MANEAVLVYETHQPIQMTVDNGTGIEKGTLLTLSDPMTAAAVTVSQAATAGIAHSEKIANDGNTKLAVYRGGIFKLVASGAITVGTAFMFTNSNKVVAATINDEHLAGMALETATDGETFLGELNPQHINVA